MPTPANANRISPEQSYPTVPAPSSIPRLGPAAVPPPHEYGTPIWDMARRITYSDACCPYTRGMRPLVIPVSVGLMMPSWVRNCRPMFAVTCDEVAEMPSRELMIAIGSPLTNALGIAGSVGSHREASQLLVLLCGAAGPAPGVLQRSPGVAAAAASAAGGRRQGGAAARPPVAAARPAGRPPPTGGAGGRRGYGGRCRPGGTAGVQPCLRRVALGGQPIDRCLL